MFGKKAKKIEALIKQIADKDATIKKLKDKNKCAGSKCSEKTQQSKKKTVKIQPVASGKGKGRSGAKDAAGGKKGSKKTVKKS